MINKDFLMGYGAGKAAGGGGGDVTVQEKNITSNGTYRAPSGTAFNPVNVSVPNTYAAGDEGKVVSDGELVAQTSAQYTLNDTYDTTLIDSVTVAVFGQSNVITGEFTTGDKGTITEVSVPYNGNGFPIMVAVWWDSGNDHTQYTSGETTHQMMMKKTTKNAPVYDSNIPDYDDDGDEIVLEVMNYNGNSSGTGLSGLTMFSTGDMNSSYWYTCFHFTANTTMEFQVAPNGKYGYVANAKYKYVVVYSS